MVKFLWIFAIALICLSACDDFTSSPRFEGDVYTLAALLKAGKPISISDPVYITKSSLISEFDPYEMFISEAEVKITEKQSNTSWYLEPQVDLEEMKLKWIDPDAHIIQAEHDYQISITIPGYDPVISAETRVPPVVEVVPDFYGYNIASEGYSFSPEDQSGEYYDQIDVRYPIALNTKDREDSFNLFAEIFCLEEFSTDLEYTTAVLGMTHVTEDMESSYYSSGESLRRILFLGRFDSIPQDGEEDNFILVKDYRQGFIFYGKYRVSVYVTDDNHYRYHYMPEGYLHGGVQNALGYFGSASGGVMYIEVLKAP
ncbi:MAG: hypothetical protein PWP64_1612 [Candidatus Cloacimonadota bacterium]|nr:hypothetical protein [Candidatus Cloacimonadota bacterium]